MIIKKIEKRGYIMKMHELMERKNVEHEYVERYVGVRFSEKTKNQIAKFIEENEIDNPESKKDFHTTVVYSQEPLNKTVSVLGDIDPPFVGTKMTFDIWKSQDGKNVLVMKYISKDLTDRHEYFMEKGGATHDFDDFTCHVSLSYDIDEEFDISKLEWTYDPLEIVSEYTEKLRV
jgi:hypothetical protein